MFLRSNLYLILILVPAFAIAQFQSDSYRTKATLFAPLDDESVSFNPIIGDNGTSLWVTRTDHPMNYGGESDQDIWYLKYDNGEWSSPKNQYEGLNSEAQDLIVGQSLNTTIYLVRFKRGSESDLTTIQAFKKFDDEYVHDHDISLPNLRIKGSFFGFFVGRDERYVIISMKGDFSFGKEDLYICKKDGEAWSDPIHMGARINSSGFEMSPYVSKDEKHLFFSSDGHQGFGSGDIYVSTRLDDSWQNWSRPLNLGPNINKEGFEAYFCLNETLNEAYFFSDEERSGGAMHRIPFTPDPSVVKPSSHQTASGFIKLKQLPVMNIKLNLMDENDQVVQSIVTNEDGYFNLQAFLPDKDYRIAIDEELKSELDEAEIFLTNDLGERMVFMNEDELGIFGFKVLSGERFEAVDDFELEAKRGKVVDKPTKITGKVNTYGTLTEKVPLKIMDENNQVVKSIETDEEGYFSFSTDASEKRYFLSIDEQMVGLVDVYEVFLTNENPEEDIVVSKTDKHLFEFSSLINRGNSGLKLLDERDYGMPQHFFETLGMMPKLNDGDLVGFLRLDSLPIIAATINLLDEEDKVLGTASTDSLGRFTFDMKLIEGDYQLQLTEGQDELLEGSEVFLAKNPDDVLFYLNDERSGVFAFKKLARNSPISLNSLKEETMRGEVVNAEMTTLKGKFTYKSLPKSGVTLYLMDDNENVVQSTVVNKKGEFQFDRYTTDRNYFISVEDEGLSDIYEVYLTGEQKNVLVNRMDKYVFAFRVLPSKDVVLTQAFETDHEMRLPRIPKHMVMGEGIGDQKRSYHEFDLDFLKRSDYLSLHRIVKDYNEDFQVVLRLYLDQSGASSGKELRSIQMQDVQPVIDRLVEFGVQRSEIEVRTSVSDQALLILK